MPMTRALPRTKFHSSELLRCLAGMELLDTVDAGSGFAEKLGEWIHFTDAITLSAVHNEMPAHAANGKRDARRTAAAAAAAAHSEFDRVKSMLTSTVNQSFALRPGSKVYNRLPEAPREMPANAASACLPYRRFYEAHQRDMELNIQPLRNRIRAAVASTSPKMRKLAELDAIFERILAPNERIMLARVPASLATRFANLYRTHQENAIAGPPDDPAGWTLPGGWLARFALDMQQLLRAELDLRLQPTLGLLEAINKDVE